MGKQYPIKLLGEIKQVLGTEVIWGPDWAVLRMTRNIIHVAKEYRVLELADKTSKVPLTKADIDSLEMPTEISGIAPYRYLLGELAWISSTQQDFIFHIRMMASYAGKHTGRSTTGTSTFLQGNLINFTSNIQKTVALSSTEAERMSSTEGAKEIQFSRHLLRTWQPNLLSILSRQSMQRCY